MRSLQSIFIIALLMGSAILFMGCPMSTKYPLGTGKEQKIDKNLLGVWHADSSKAEAQKFTIKRLDDYTYDVVVDSGGEFYVAESKKFKGWTTQVEGMTFFVLQAIVDGNATEEYYQYYFEVKDGKLTTKDLSLKVGGVDAIVSTETYREEVSASMKYESFLVSPLGYTKQ